MKTKDVTFSLPIDIVDSLQALVEKQSLDQFAAKALALALEEKRQILRKAYIAANADEDRESTIAEWLGND